MKIDPVRLGFATAAAIAIAWTICVALVAGLPGMSMTMAGSMMHADFASMHWVLSPYGFVIGLLAWSVSGGLTAALVALFYNWMGPKAA